MHEGAYAFVQAVAPRRPKGLVVEIGGRNINGTIRDLFKDDRYVSVDIRNGTGVDIVADGASFMPSEPPACVVCCEVLEHTTAAEAICRNAFDMLAPGGIFIVTTATTGRAAHSSLDGGPLRPNEFYRNVTEQELRSWLRPFPRVTIEQHQDRGDIYAVAYKGAA